MEERSQVSQVLGNEGTQLRDLAGEQNPRKTVVKEITTSPAPCKFLATKSSPGSDPHANAHIKNIFLGLHPYRQMETG
jgi:hypothetical protein